MLLNTFFAQHIAERLRLPDLVNTKRYQQQLQASVITLNPAIRDQVKSGHREWPKT